ncbi:helix-turn-helix transcriptional regulator [Paracoccus aurantiacus]|uniref:Helix-turn-helix transcriptional regulator n=1 Tax=Paracoccus aurantiacus TaxID=2599412 RepID=A0A5C6S7T5_9RHOB|nr:helix-turn-helix domain-containing protein [Paracoccus aurantiacus]TXB70919.1 helix-turn-helix transcriptional regulator [Paracoccus aurantiacus]
MRAFKHPQIEDVAIADVLHALSDPIRLGIVAQLAQEGEASCSALDGGRPKSSMSHHFRVLRDAGIIMSRPEGVSHLNTLRRDDLNDRFPGLLDAVLGAVR